MAEGVGLAEVVTDWAAWAVGLGRAFHLQRSTQAEALRLAMPLKVKHSHMNVKAAS